MGFDFPAEGVTFKHLATFDVIEKFAPLFAEGYFIDNDTGLITCNSAQEYESPWDHVKPHPELRCRQWRKIFQCLGFIPSGCLNCWKVVVRPRTIQELFALRDLQREMDVYCKCGTEHRDWTPAERGQGKYGGYFYCRGKQEGLERYRQVRAAVSEAISPNVGVILKRYCTEFEVMKGDSAKYAQPPHAAEWEKIVEKVFDPGLWKVPCDKPPQPWFVKLRVYRKWIEFAWKFEKSNAEVYNDGEPLYTIPRTYHQEIE